MLTTHSISKFNERKAGFSLIELSLVLVIISMVLGFGLSYAAKKTDFDRIQETKQKLKLIEKAVYKHVMAKRYIPCPSYPETGEDQNDFGRGQSDAGDPSLCAQSPSFLGLRSGNMVWGVVPTSTLEISDDLAYDAWGRFFSYIITEHCNANELLHPTLNFASANACGGGGSPGMIIKDASGSTIMSDAVLVIMSHGKNGYGTFVGHGTSFRLPSPTVIVSADEQENSHLDISDITGATIAPAINNIFVARSVDLNADLNSYFDDIILFKNRRQLIEGGHGIFYGQSSACNLVQNFTNGLITSAQLCGTKTNANCQTIIDSLKAAVSGFCY